MERILVMPACEVEALRNNSIKQLITQSRQRCIERKMDPHKITNVILDAQTFHKIEKQNAIMIKIARSIINKLYEIVKNSGFVITLTDNQGYLLEIIGDNDIIKASRDISFVKGALWNEEVVGTNGIGFVLKHGIPVQIIDKEHYCSFHYGWTCSTAPIYNQDKKLIGCLNLSGKMASVHKHTLGMVLTATDSIEKQMYLENSNALLNATFQSISGGIITLNRELSVVSLNSKACLLLGITKHEMIGCFIGNFINNIEDMDSVLKTGAAYSDVDFELSMKNKKLKCMVNIVPIQNNEIINGVVITFEKSKLFNKIANKVVGNRAVYTFDDILTKDENMKNLIHYAQNISKKDATVLISGESGTGKELFAHAIHNASHRRNEPFVAINCGSIPDELIESELFGYEKGVFTGARNQGYIGKFELADGGTIFLDEIGELPLNMQVKLLRTLDNKMVRRIGGDYERFIDVRIITATNKNLLQEVKNKNFRGDLYYRLNVICIEAIPLRDRPKDIEMLSHHFIELLNQGNHLSKKIDQDYIKRLGSRSFEGNVRELKNSLERAYYSSDDLVMDQIKKADKKIMLKKQINIEEAESINLINALQECNNDVVKAAQLMGISRATFYRKMKKYNLKVKR